MYDIIPERTRLINVAIEGDEPASSFTPSTLCIFKLILKIQFYRLPIALILKGISGLKRSMLEKYVCTILLLKFYIY
jgi:hypothetical protein